MHSRGRQKRKAWQTQLICQVGHLQAFANFRLLQREQMICGLAYKNVIPAPLLSKQLAAKQTREIIRASMH